MKKKDPALNMKVFVNYLTMIIALYFEKSKGFIELDPSLQFPRLAISSASQIP